MSYKLAAIEVEIVDVVGGDVYVLCYHVVFPIHRLVDVASGV